LPIIYLSIFNLFLYRLGGINFTVLAILNAAYSQY